MSSGAEVLDLWHPELVFAPTPHEFRIYGDDRAAEWAVIDEIDYQWAIQWRWSIKNPILDFRRGHNRYFYRTARKPRPHSVYLHVEIMKRTGIPPPTVGHVIVDHHGDGNTFNCRRDNLGWATHAMNRATRRLF